MISLEMVGFYRDERGSQGAPPGLELGAGVRGDYLAAVGNPSSRGFARVLDPFQRVAALRVPRSRRPRRRSRTSTLRPTVPGRRLPALMLTDTAEFRNPNYHRPTDTPDTLDYARMGEVTLGLVRALAALAK
jgi:hypothetical protein